MGPWDAVYEHFFPTCIHFTHFTGYNLFSFLKSRIFNILNGQGFIDKLFWWFQSCRTVHLKWLALSFLSFIENFAGTPKN